MVYGLFKAHFFFVVVDFICHRMMVVPYYFSSIFVGVFNLLFFTFFLNF